MEYILFMWATDWTCVYLYESEWVRLSQSEWIGFFPSRLVYVSFVVAVVVGWWVYYFFIRFNSIIFLDANYMVLFVSVFYNLFVYISIQMRIKHKSSSNKYLSSSHYNWIRTDINTQQKQQATVQNVKNLPNPKLFISNWTVLVLLPFSVHAISLITSPPPSLTLLYPKTIKLSSTTAPIATMEQK